MIFKDFFPIVRLRFGSVYAKEERAEYVCSDRQPIADWLFVEAEARLAARAENAVGHETCCAAERERERERAWPCEWAPVCVCACVKECLCMWMPESEPGRERLCERSERAPPCNRLTVRCQYRESTGERNVLQQYLHADWMRCACTYICVGIQSTRLTVRAEWEESKRVSITVTSWVRKGARKLASCTVEQLVDKINYVMVLLYIF